MVHLGNHRAACPVSGRLRRRAKPIELAGSAIFAKEEAGVDDQVLLRDNTKPVDSRDSRPLDFVACPNCGDTPVVSPLHRDGTPHLLTPDMDGASFSRAVAHEEATYLELIRQNQYGELAVLACFTDLRKVGLLLESEDLGGGPSILTSPGYPTAHNTPGDPSYLGVGGFCGCKCALQPCCSPTEDAKDAGLLWTN